MSAQKASAPVRFARLAVAVILLVLAAAIIIHLLRERGGPRPDAVITLPEDRVVDLKEKVRHEEYTDGKLRTEVRGADFFLGSDGRNHLKGSVEITGYGPAGEVVSRITADEVVYDSAAVRFGITGRVRVEAGDVVLEGDSFEYDKDNGLFRTVSGGTFSANSISGEAKEITYAENADEVRLGGGFEVGFSSSGRPRTLDLLAGDSLVYKRRERRAQVDGRAEYWGGRFRGKAESLSFIATEDEGALASVAFDGRTQIVLLGGPGSGGRQSGYVHADTVEVLFRRGSGLVSMVMAAGAVVFTMRSGTDRETPIHASAANLEFGADGELDRWSASGGFRAELGGSADESRVLEGESVAFEASTRVLRASGKPGRPAVADSRRARIEAPSLAAGPAGGDLEASGGVKCLLKPGEKGLAAGFFSAAKPIFVSGANLVFRGGTKVFSFAGEVQAWQDKEFLLAGELDLSEGAGEMRGRGGVAAGMTQAAAGETPERRIEIGGEEMVYSAAGRVLSFRKKSYVQMPGARLGAETIDAVRGREEKGVDTFTALTSVVVSEGRYEGRGDKAFYEAGADRITLTGRPVLVDKEGGSTRGDKLTFDLGDGKIRIENEGQGRSITVVKS
jgi:lipopolysaccharide export system protein LptA